MSSVFVYMLKPSTALLIHVLHRHLKQQKIVLRQHKQTHQLVMADKNSGEKLLISGKSLRRYGSTCNHVKKQEYFVTHDVQKTDTLQGLALKYNTTTEQIRRVNRLYASDSLFLRATLKIPVSKDVADNNHSAQPSVTSPTSTDNEQFSDDDQKSVNDFLGKIDSSIASTKAHVNHVQHRSHFVDARDPTMPKRASSREVPASLEATSSDVPHPVVLSHGRKVRNSLQRLEKEQDALFEL